MINEENKIMKKLAVVLMASFIWACNNDGGQNGNGNSDTGERPRDVNEGVTNSTKILNDSVIVPDTNNTGINPSRNDTSGKKMD